MNEQQRMRLVILGGALIIFGSGIGAWTWYQSEKQKEIEMNDTTLAPHVQLASQRKKLIADLAAGKAQTAANQSKQPAKPGQTAAPNPGAASKNSSGGGTMATSAPSDATKAPLGQTPQSGKQAPPSELDKFPGKQAATQPSRPPATTSQPVTAAAKPIALTTPTAKAQPAQNTQSGKPQAEMPPVRPSAKPGTPPPAQVQGASQPVPNQTRPATQAAPATAKPTIPNGPPLKAPMPPIGKAPEAQMDSTARAAGKDGRELVQATTHLQASHAAHKSVGRSDPTGALEAYLPFPRSLHVPDSGDTTASKAGDVPPPPGTDANASKSAAAPKNGGDKAGNASSDGLVPPPPPESGADDLGLEDLPPPPDKPHIAEKLKVLAVMDNHAIVSFPVSMSRQNNWPKFITLTTGQQFDSLKVVQISPDGITVEEDGERSLKPVPAIK